jgi:HEAT repeat protein
VDVEVVIESAVKLGFDSETVHAALIDVDLDSLEDFVHQLNSTRYNSLKREVIKHLVKIAEVSGEEKAFFVLDLALDVSHGEIRRVITSLGKIESEKALVLIRKAIQQGWDELRNHAAEVIINVQYTGNPAQALQDVSEIVRRVAILQLEKHDDTQALIAALENDYAFVRQVSSWYMGRKLVSAAADKLIERLQVEEDIEALRAAIWSLGMLRASRAVVHLESLSQHSNPLIVTTVHDALTRIA